MTVKILIAAGALLASTSAWAQTSPAQEQTADDLVCQLSGDCGGMDAIEATQDKPDSRGFRLARKSSAAEPAPAIASVTRSRARVTSDATRPAAATAAPGRSRTIVASSPRAGSGRADLRVSFVTGSAELTGAGRLEADKLITALGSPSLAGKKFRIEGHTDSVGSRESNIDLSKRRAQAVVEYLVAKGADRSQFTVAGYGFDKPIAGTSASNGVNRRVEVVLVK